MRTILFLGYKKSETTLISFLRKKKFKVVEYGQKPLKKEVLDKKFHIIISFGYKIIIKESLLKYINRPIVNLHISYLPYNRGAHPNYWSFINNTPKGVSIHEINSKIDKGNLILRKKINFGKKKEHTFKSTHNTLISEVENLFKKNINLIFSRKYKKINTKILGSYHSKSQLPKSLISWDVKISEYLKNYFK